MRMRNVQRWASLTQVCLIAISGTTLLADGPGVRPRPDARAYPASLPVPHGTVAAAVLSAREVRDRFATDLNKGYVVLEVAFYPEAAGHLKISPDDFLLKGAGQDTPARPAEPAVVARAIQEKNGPKQASNRKVDVYPVATVGYESGTYDDGSGVRTRHSGWNTGVGVGVGIGGSGGGYPTGPYSDRDRSSMEAELFDKSLPEGVITQPTAGYVYFPAAKARRKNGAYELQYLGQAGTLTLAIPAPREK